MTSVEMVTPEGGNESGEQVSTSPEGQQGPFLPVSSQL